MTMHAHSEPDQTAAASGVLFVVLFIGGLIPLGALLGSFGDSDATFDAYFASTGNRAASIVGGALLFASAFVFIWFLVQLRRALQRDDGRSAAHADFVFASGIVFVALLLVGTAALVTVPVTLVFAGLFDDEPFEAGQAVLPQLGSVVLALFAMWSAGVMIAATTVAARRSGSFPRWLCRLGFVVTGLVVLLGTTVVGVVALPAWVLAVSVHWFRTQKARSADNPIAPAARNDSTE